MLELYRNTISSQLNAALTMFKEAVTQCPDENWEGNVGNHAFWHVAYHTLFFTDLYLSRDDKSFEAPGFYREDYHFLGKKPFPPYEEVVADEPYTRDVILKYVELCRSKLTDALALETVESLEGPSGFFWYEVPRAELYLINIRHVQHHGAQMGLYLRKAAGIGIDWVGASAVEQAGLLNLPSLVDLPLSMDVTEEARLVNLCDLETGNEVESCFHSTEVPLGER